LNLYRLLSTEREQSDSRHCSPRTNPSESGPRKPAKRQPT
jgi:hypothetical protein